MTKIDLSVAPVKIKIAGVLTSNGFSVFTD